MSVIFSKETQIWHKKKSEKKLNKIEINEKSYINALESIKSNINTETLMQEAISNEFNIRKVNYEDVISSIQLANTSYKKLSNNGVTDRITNTDALKDIHDKFFK